MGTATVSEPVQDDVVRSAARAGEPDRYLSALLAPRQARPGLIALAAFLADTSRAVAVAREPMMGEIRLQWWRDAVKDGAPTGNPVADALLRAIVDHGLPYDQVSNVLDARLHELEPSGAASSEDLIAQVVAGERSAFMLAARVLRADARDEERAVIESAAQSWGRVRALRALPLALARGRASPLTIAHNYEGSVPVDWAIRAAPVIEDARKWLNFCRARVASCPAVLPAVLPIALVEPYLQSLQRLGSNIARERADISPLTRVWRLWLANALKRP